VYACSVGTTLLSFVSKNAGDTDNVVGVRENPSVDPSRESLHDQAAGSRESSKFIDLEHDRPF
jgi:hypothetical protein